MSRPIAARLALALALVAPSIQGADAPTRFRKRHTIVLCAKAGEDVSATVRCVSASRGYPHNAAYIVLDPFGRLIAKGSASVGESRAIGFSPKTTGPYTIDVDPGMNAFCIEPNTRDWAVDISEGRQLNVIAHVRDVYFWVPQGVKSFTLRMSGEPGEATVCDGSGRVVRTQALPLYTRVEIALDVPAGQSGCAWRLKLDLQEDMAIVFPAAIPPYVAERPITEAMLEDLQGGRGLTRFDLQVTPSGALKQAAPGEAVHRIRTSDGLGLAFNSSGQIARVQLDGKTVKPTDGTPLTGFFIRDVAAGPDLVPARAKIEEVGHGLRQTGAFPATDIHLAATLTAKSDHVAVSGRIEDASGRDRAVSLYFALPVAARGTAWWDTIDEVRTIGSRSDYGYYSAARVGANGKSSVYPFAGAAGLALGIPLDRPCINRIAYNGATEQLYTVFDFALTPATRKFPQRASFRFVVYRHDPLWGLRSAAKKYYGIFPRLVEKRMKRDGGWVCWGDTKRIEPLSDFGFLYHWGPGGASAVAHDDKIGIYSFLYNDSVRFFADLGTFPKKPDGAACTKVFEDYLRAPDPRAFVLSRPAKATGRRRYESLERGRGREQATACLRACVDAVGVSAAHNRDGGFIVGYVINRKDWGPPNWWTGRLFCNPDPDIPGGYGQFLFNEVIGRTFTDYRNSGGELDGVGLDNYFTYSRYPNFRREHFAHVDYPLTFPTAEFRPVQVGDFALYEWVEALAAKLRGQGKFIMANMGVCPFPFAAYLLDMHGYEWNIERVAHTARVLAYHKPVVTLPVKPDHYTESWIRKHVRFGIHPGGYGRGDRFEKGGELRRIYKRYVPVIRDLAQAGWEPVTWATTDTSNVRIERFGTEGQPLLYFTVDNANDRETTCDIRVDTHALRCRPGALRIATRLCGRVVSTARKGDTMSVALLVPAKCTSVLVLTRP